MGCFAEERTVYREDLERLCRINKVQTVKQLVDTLYDSKLNEWDSVYSISRYNEPDKTKWWQRVNCLWVCPLMVIHNVVNWFRTGHFEGVRKESKLGKILVKLVGV